MRILSLSAPTLRDLAPPSPLVRSPGLHLTQITGHILRRLDPKRYGREMSRADTENYQDTGFLWEDILGRVLADRAGQVEGSTAVRFRPGEVEKDGVIGSPDALVLQDDQWVVEEYKATWKSARGLDEPNVGSGLTDSKFVGYILQSKAYCAMVGATTARLFIFFINGTYGDRMVPEVRAYQLTWTAQEIAEGWQEIVNTAKKEGWL